MINGAHTILYSGDADATRATLAKVLGTLSVDAGGGWLILALPPAEVAVHTANEGGRAELYLPSADRWGCQVIRAGEELVAPGDGLLLE